MHVYDPTTERELAEQLSLDYTTRHQGSLTLIPLSDAFKGDNTTLLADLDVMDIPAEVKDDSRSPEDRLRAFLEPLSPTSRTSLVQHIRTQLLARIARSRGHSVLLLGHTSTRLASCTLANIALGRGWSLGEEVASLYRNSKGEL